MDGLVIGGLAAASVLSFALRPESIPPQIYWTDQKVERLYKVDNRIVAEPVFSPVAAESACPLGSQIVRQESRTEGNREYLVWVLRCRSDRFWR